MARIYFAGAENSTHLSALIQNGATNVLFSFFYVNRRGQLQALLRLLEDYPSVNIFLDSGAFSFQAGTARSSPEDYFKRYKAFLKDFGHYFEFAAELDVDDFVEQEQLDEWRAELVDVGTVPIVPVWHANRGYEEWENYCNDPRYPHLGLGSEMEILGGRRDTRSIQARLVNRAHYLGKTVHGFAQTKIMTTLKVVKYDTVDSTSWKSAERFGTTYIFQHNQWKAFSKDQGMGKQVRRQYRRYFESIGCNFRKVMADDIDEMRKASVVAWERLSQRLQVIHKSHVGLSLNVADRDGGTYYSRSRHWRLKAQQEPGTSHLALLRRPAKEFGHVKKTVPGLSQDNRYRERPRARPEGQTSTSSNIWPHPRSRAGEGPNARIEEG